MNARHVVLELSVYTQRRLAEGKILLAWVSAAVESPDWIARDRDPTLTWSFKAVAEFGGRILKVVHRPAGPNVFVVCALRSRSQAMMRTSYDPKADAFYARFAPDGVEIATTSEVVPGVILDLDADGQLVGIEVLSVATRGSGAYGLAVPQAA